MSKHKLRKEPWLMRALGIASIVATMVFFMVLITLIRFGGSIGWDFFQ